jgi:hypothetical protein
MVTVPGFPDVSGEDFPNESLESWPGSKGAFPEATHHLPHSRDSRWRLPARHRWLILDWGLPVH